jgi:hypothetical protein
MVARWGEGGGWYFSYVRASRDIEEGRPQNRRDRQLPKSHLESWPGLHQLAATDGRGRA